MSVALRAVFRNRRRENMVEVNMVLAEYHQIQHGFHYTTKQSDLLKLKKEANNKIELMEKVRMGHKKNI